MRGVEELENNSVSGASGDPGFLCDAQFRTVAQLPAVPAELKDPVGSRSLIDKRRFVRPSQGKLRFVEIRGFPDDPSAVDDDADAEPALEVWTLAGDPEKLWNAEYSVRFCELWTDSTYAAAGLTPGKVPTLGPVDPSDHGVVYLFEGDLLFGVDLRKRRMVTWERGCFVDSTNHQDKFQYSRFIDVCNRPPALVPTASASDEQIEDWRNLIRVNGPNPLGHLRAPPSAQQQGAQEAKETHDTLEDAIRCVNLKIEGERNRKVLGKLIRDRRYLRRMLDDDKGSL